MNFEPISELTKIYLIVRLYKYSIIVAGSSYFVPRKQRYTQERIKYFEELFFERVQNKYPIDLTIDAFRVHYEA
jgi:hypothetical protein